MSRLTQILRGKKIKPLTEMESAVKYAIDNAGSGGGSSLPAVTSADNGDLLGVVEGAWGKVDPPAGGETFTVTFTRENDSWTANKTIAEILEAYEGGKRCIAVGEFVGVPGVEGILQLFVNFEPNDTVMFSGCSTDEIIAIVTMAGRVQDDTDVWMLNITTINNPPAVDSGDNGKVLEVVDGAWAKGGKYGALECIGTQGTQDEKTIMTLNVTVGELIEAVEAGRALVVSASDPVAGNYRMCSPVVYTSVENDGATTYYIRIDFFGEFEGQFTSLNDNVVLESTV